MKIVTIVGARPQFVKAAMVSHAIALNDEIREVIVHTGQHYDQAMSDIFFEELRLPEPQYNLGISGGAHGEMTGRMMAAIETVLIEERPDLLLVYGDTNSTLAGALAAAKLWIPVAHVEAGLRSFNMRMPEEVNRVVTDRLSALLLCPTETAVQNLNAEGRTDGVHNVGDVMYDAVLKFASFAESGATAIDELGLGGRDFVLATCHRAENVDDRSRLENILGALADLAHETPVVLPLHPRTRGRISEFGFERLASHIRIIEPVSYLNMIQLEQAAKLILTDSGGMQKEAFFFKVPCITMRDETEWTETVALGWNILTGASKPAIMEAFDAHKERAKSDAEPYGNGHAAVAIVAMLAGIS